MQGDDAMAALLEDRLRNDAGMVTKTLLIVGPPASGKTTVALRALLRAIGAYGDDRVVMTVANRKTARSFADRIVRRIGISSQARPVTTLPAVAFHVIATVRARLGLPAPRLLSGAEQDTLLRRVMARHVHHAQVGDDCKTCDLLREYFAADSWASFVAGTGATAAAAATSSTSAAPSPLLTSSTSSQPSSHTAARAATSQTDSQTAPQAATSETMLSRGINDAFIVQLRDMLSRMNELGASHLREQEILEQLGDADIRAARLRVQWRLAFALRAEYARMIERDYAHEHRLDSSRLLVEGITAVDRANAEELPRCIVVDDFQDLTVAGLSFIAALHRHGCTVVVTGNPDESVQSFRGSYPEYLYDRMLAEPFHAAVVRLSSASVRPAPDHAPKISKGRPTAPDFLALLASRVSLSIQTVRSDETALPQRPGKMPWYDGALPVATLAAENRLPSDGSVDHGLYRSAQEELDDIVWRIKTIHLSGRHSWNDCVIIAHDNATVRTFGERLRRDGVPVRYSSVTRPLGGEPFVQGLFALIELAQLRNRGLRAISYDAVKGTGRFVRARVRALMESPLVTLTGRANGEPARLSAAESAMTALSTLAAVMPAPAAEGADGDENAGDLLAVVQAWRAWCVRSGCEQADDGPSSAGQIHVDDRLMRSHDMLVSQPPKPPVFADDAARDVRDARGVRPARDEHDDHGAYHDRDERSVRPLPFDRDALYLLLAADGYGEIDAERILARIRAVSGDNPHVKAFIRLWSLVDQVAEELATLSRPEPQYALSVAWQACHVAQAWQRMALDNTDDGRSANDRLDMAMRLFDYAQGSGASRDIDGFLEQIRSMRIEADSLAKVAPIDEAVTLTTPAGAEGQHWPLVWVVAVQQGVWPNLTARNTMFGGEDLARMLLYGHVDDHDAPTPGYRDDDAFASVLAAEQRAFLVAITRATACATVSAVVSEDMTPSDFLYGYLPESFDRQRDSVGGVPEFSQHGGAASADAASDGEVADMDTDPRGLVALARVRLAQAALARPSATDSLQDEVSQDAADALALLAAQGIDAADPANWAYCNDTVQDAVGQDDTSGGAASADGADHGRVGHADGHADDRVDDADHVDDHAGDTGYADDRVGAGRHPAVTLSPSAVDGLWACPVCWLLEHRLAGPAVGNASQHFGTVIHHVAQLASEEGLDLPTWKAEVPVPERIEAVTERMMELYRQERGGLEEDADVAEQYRAVRNDAEAEHTLANIASYFVLSNIDDYLGANAKKFEIGRLERVRCEVPFEARIDLRDILAVCQGAEGLALMTLDDLYGIMGALVGGWPEGMDSNLRIRLAGRIDRLETRITSDGVRRLRIIDYKSGASKPTVKHMLNDLQLVCYQLGLRFEHRLGAEDDMSATRGSRVRGSGVHESDVAAAPAHGDASISDADILSAQPSPSIEQSELFYMRNSAAPAMSRDPEGLYQPALFVDGHINDRVFTPRNYIPRPDNLEVPELADEPPAGVSGRTWRALLGLRGTQAIWTITMIARVWYAAAASRSNLLIARPTSEHLGFCRMLSVCPACAGHSETIFDMRKS